MMAKAWRKNSEMPKQTSILTFDQWQQYVNGNINICRILRVYSIIFPTSDFIEQ